MSEDELTGGVGGSGARVDDQALQTVDVDLPGDVPPGGAA